jgi:hypothetical protein
LAIATLVVAGGGSFAGQATADAATHVIPATIDTTGTADVAAALLAFFATVPDGSTIEFPAGARYRADTTLLLRNRANLTFEGNGATVFATVGSGDRVRAHWSFRGGSGITIRNLTVKGANPFAGTSEAAYRSTKEAQHGFEFGGVNRVELDRVTVTDVYGDFVYLGRQAVAPWPLSSNVWIHDSHFERNGRQGVAFTGAVDVLIERSYIGRVRRTMFDLEPTAAAGEVRRVTIRDNDLGPARFALIAANGNFSAPMGDITVTGNRLAGLALNGKINAWRVRRGPFTFTGNVSDRGTAGPSGAQLGFFRIDGVTVTGNTVKVTPNRNMSFVSTRESCDVAVSGNVVQGGAEHRTDGYEATGACGAGG